MAVYVDNAGILYKGKRRHHMAADSLEELHTFCQSIDVKRCWFHNSKRHPHYDVTDEQRQRAIEAGAEAVDARTLMGKAKALSPRSSGAGS